MAPRTLPHSEESERAVLGGLLLDPAELAATRARLEPSDFYVERHQVLYTAMLAVADAGSTIDMLTLQAHLEQAGGLEAVGGLAYLASLDVDLPDIGRLDQYVEIVRDRSTRRALIAVSRQTITAAAGTAEPVGELLASLRGKAEILHSGAVRARWSGVGTAIDGLMEAIEAGRAEQLQGLPTGFPAFDTGIGGLLPGTLIVLAGRPGMGKTSFAVDLVRHTALGSALTCGGAPPRPPLPVGVFSLEMDQEELALKLLSGQSQIPTKYLRSGHASTRQWTEIWKAARHLGASPLLIDDQPDLTLRELEGRARRLLAEYPTLALLVVDYLQLLPAGERTANRRQEVGLVTRRLKTLARSLRVPIVALSQLNRENVRRSDPRPHLGDLAESGEIEGHADAVIFVHRPEYYSPDDDEVRGLAELVVAKNRHGETGTVELAWLAPITSFRTLRRQEPAAGADPF